MQGKIYLNLSGDNALSPLPTIGVWQGSAVTLFVGGLPRKCGKVEVTAVNVAIKNADGETQSLGATYAGGWWAVTFSAAVFAHSGIVKNGVTVSADGLDELGGAVEGWILRKGDLEVREADGTIRPGEIVDEMRWYDVAPESPRKGDVAPVEDVISLYDGEEWRPLGSSVALDDTVTETSANGVKSSGIWSFVKGLLPSWLTPSREEPPTQASVAAKYTKPSEGIPLSDMEVSVFPPEAHAHTNDSWFTTAIEAVKSWATNAFAALTHSHLTDSWFTGALDGKLDKSGGTLTGNITLDNATWTGLGFTYRDTWGRSCSIKFPSSTRDKTIAVTDQVDAKVGSFSAVGGVTPTVSGGVADVSALFTIDNTLLKQTIIDVAGEKVNIGVTAVTQDGVMVTGQTVYVHNGTSADDPVVASIAYNGQPVTLTVDKGIQYFVRISDTLAMHFNPTTASGYATADVSVTLTYADVSTVTDLNDIAPALAAINDLAQARTLLVGKEFPDVWIDYDGSGSGDATPAQVDSHPAWNDPLILTDVQMVEDASGNTHLGAVLMRKYAMRYDIVFDAPNTEEATEETAQEGLYYYGLAKGATAPAAGNVTYLDLTTGDAIPYADYEKVYRNTLRESFGATTKIVADNNVFRYGHNRYETSAYRQYLNSSAAKGEWWSQQHIGQMKPSSASSYSGYMRGCSAKLLSLIKPVKRRCVPNYNTDGGSSSDQDVGLYTVCDDFFLPCCGEMFGTSNNNEVFFNDEYNYQYTYWRDLVDNPAQAPGDNVAAINDVRKVKRINAKNGTAFVGARLRSATRGSSCYVGLVYTGGYLSYVYNASSAFASVPACVIY